MFLLCSFCVLFDQAPILFVNPCRGSRLRLRIYNPNAVALERAHMTTDDCLLASLHFVALNVEHVILPDSELHFPINMLPQWVPRIFSPLRNDWRSFMMSIAISVVATRFGSATCHVMLKRHIAAPGRATAHTMWRDEPNSSLLSHDTFSKASRVQLEHVPYRIINHKSREVRESVRIFSLAAKCESLSLSSL